MPLTQNEAVILAFFRYLDNNNNAAALALLEAEARLITGNYQGSRALFAYVLYAFPGAVRKVVYPPAVVENGNDVRVIGSVIHAFVYPPTLGSLNLLMTVNNGRITQSVNQQAPGASASTAGPTAAEASAPTAGTIFPWPRGWPW